MKLPTILNKVSEESLRAQIQEIGYPALQERLLAVLEATKYIYTVKKTDPIEYHAFLAGMTTTLHAIKFVLESEVP